MEELLEAVFSIRSPPHGCVTAQYRSFKKMIFLLGPSQGNTTRTDWYSVTDLTWLVSMRVRLRFHKTHLQQRSKRMSRQAEAEVHVYGRAGEFSDFRTSWLRLLKLTENRVTFVINILGGRWNQENLFVSREVKTSAHFCKTSTVESH
jgi:hypothetical protein